MSAEELDDPADDPDGVDGDGDGEDRDPAELAAQIDLLAEENRRLRREYVRARRSQYRRTALGLVGVGLLGVAGAAAFPAARTVLLALGATGLFAGLLTYYLTPEQFIPAHVGEQIYAALAANGAALAADLGLTDARVYVPTGDSDDPVRLFVPQHERYNIPDNDALADVFVVTDDERARGVSLGPTGQALFDEFERVLAGPLRNEPGPLAEQLADALVEQFELVASTRVDVNDEDSRVTVGVSGSAYGAVDRFDHPVASLLAVGFVHGLDRPVRVDVTPGDDRVDYLVTCILEQAT